jgi:phosphatidate cytidylyltransferase
LALVALAGAGETYRLARSGGRRPSTALALLAPALVLAAAFPAPEAPGALLALAVILAFGAQIGRPAAERSADDWAMTLAAPVYVGGLMAFGVLLRDLVPGGLAWTLAGVAMVWANDSAAYFGGRLWGRTPLSPTLSPKKTREGFLAGLVASVLLAALLPALARAWPAPEQLAPLGLVPAWQLALLGAAVALVAPLGDLAKSFLKRQVGVKDSGNLFPGHGGVLDRTDSLLFAAPVAYYGARLIMALARLP